MENNENTTEPTKTEDAPQEAPPAEAPPAEAPQAQAEQAADPSVIGRLTPEEQTALMRIRAESQQLLAKVGEHELMKLRVIARIEDLDEQGQALINNVSKRLNLEDGQQWAGLQDGTIRLVNKPAPTQTQGGGAGASS